MLLNPFAPLRNASKHSFFGVLLTNQNILINIRFMSCLCSRVSSRAIAISSRRSWYSLSLCSESIRRCCSLCSLSIRCCIIIMCIIFPKDHPSPPPSPSSLATEEDGDLLGIRNGCLNALLFFFFPPPPCRFACSFPSSSTGSHPCCGSGCRGCGRD